MKTQSNGTSPIRQMQNNAANQIANMASWELPWGEQNAAGREIGNTLLKDLLATDFPGLLYHRIQQLIEANVPEGVMVGFYHCIGETAMRGAYS